MAAEKKRYLSAASLGWQSGLGLAGAGGAVVMGSNSA